MCFREKGLGEMEDNTKELIKNDILIIAKLCSTQDCSKPETAEKIYSYAAGKSIFMSPIGKSFQQRMALVAKGDINEDLCLVCRKNIASNHAICPECLNKISSIQAKKTENSSLTNQTNTENSTAPQISTSEGKQAKEFTQNLGSTVQEISANVKNVANSAQKKILDEMSSEAAQEIKSEAIAQVVDTTDNVKKVVNIAKSKWNDMTQAQKENNQQEQPLQSGDLAKTNDPTTPTNSKTRMIIGVSVVVVIFLMVAAFVGLGKLCAAATTIALCVLVYRFIKKLPKRNTVIVLLIFGVLTGVFYKDASQNIFGESEFIEQVTNRLDGTDLELRETKSEDTYQLWDRGVSHPIVCTISCDKSDNVSSIIIMSGDAADYFDECIALAFVVLRVMNPSLSDDEANDLLFNKIAKNGEYISNGIKYEYGYGLYGSGSEKKSFTFILEYEN